MKEIRLYCKHWRSSLALAGSCLDNNLLTSERNTIIIVQIKMEAASHVAHKHRCEGKCYDIKCWNSDVLVAAMLKQEK